MEETECVAEHVQVSRCVRWHCRVPSNVPIQGWKAILKVIRYRETLRCGVWLWQVLHALFDAKVQSLLLPKPTAATTTTEPGNEQKTTDSVPTQSTGVPVAQALVTTTRRPIYLAGRYLKEARGISQSPWIVDGVRLTATSVEELIAQPILAKFGVGNHHVCRMFVVTKSWCDILLVLLCCDVVVWWCEVPLCGSRRYGCAHVGGRSSICFGDY